MARKKNRKLERRRRRRERKNGAGALYLLREKREKRGREREKKRRRRRRALCSFFIQNAWRPAMLQEHKLSYVGGDATRLRAQRFELERAVSLELFGNESNDGVSASGSGSGRGKEGNEDGRSLNLGSAVCRQLSFLHDLLNVDEEREEGREGEGESLRELKFDGKVCVREVDMHTKVFRLEAQRALIGHLTGRDSSLKLRGARQQVATKLNVRTDKQAGEEEEREGQGEGERPTTSGNFFEAVFGAEELRGLLRRQDQWKETDVLAFCKENPRAQGKRIGGSGEASRPPTTNNNTLTKRKHAAGEIGGFSSKLEVDGGRSDGRTDRKLQRVGMGNDNSNISPWARNGKAANPSAPASAPAPRRESFDGSRKLVPSTEVEHVNHKEGDGDDDCENQPPAGACMFTSAKQALCSNLSAPSKRNNYSHTMGDEKKQNLGWNNPNMYKRRMGANGKASLRPKGKGGFVPPYVKKALEASDTHVGNSNERGGKHSSNMGGGGVGNKDQEDSEPPFSPKVMEMLLEYSTDGEIPEVILKLDHQLVEGICNDIMENTGISWSDIVGQEDAKRLVQEMVVWPMLNPKLFKGVRTPPKGLLLFGPPGTGKTLIGKAIASNIKATFFNISASSLTSKWIGEGEKMVRTLFTLAGHLQPAVIFIDEIDSILSARKSDGEHEASRRLKTEMLVQIEGCDPSCSERRVLIVGATNRPEELDEAARRRMPKQLYIPLPCEDARKIMIEKGILQVSHNLSSAELGKIVSKTKGYSGSDMRNFIQEACQGPVRDALSSATEESDVAKLCEQDLRPVVIKDFAMASRAQRATVSREEIERYETYNSKHGTSYLNNGSDQLEDEW